MRTTLYTHRSLLTTGGEDTQPNQVMLMYNIIHVNGFFAQCNNYSHACIHTCAYMYMFLNERKEGRKKEASKVKQTNKAKQHSTPMYVYM